MAYCISGETRMVKNSRKNGAATGSGNTTKYDAHHNVLAKAYGAQADLRRELADSKAAVAERTELLNIFAECADPATGLAAAGGLFRETFPLAQRFLQSRLVDQGLSPLRAKNDWKRPPYFSCAPIARCRRSCSPMPICGVLPKSSISKRSNRLVRQLEHWLFPSAPTHLDAPRATVRVVCKPTPVERGFGLARFVPGFFCLPQSHGRKAQDTGGNCRSDGALGSRAGNVFVRRLGIHPVAGPNPCRPGGTLGIARIDWSGTVAMAGALG